jgi:acetyltransferase-like isoleucine patch superfamily enzyme
MSDEFFDREVLQRVRSCRIAESATLMPFINLYDCEVGENCFIGPFVEIGGATIGNRTRISSHSYICPFVTIGDDCFIGHGVQFTNDTFDTEFGKTWNPQKTVVGNRVRIGSGCVILPICIGDDAVIGAGAVVTRDVPAGTTVAGVPARRMTA